MFNSRLQRKNQASSGAVDIYAQYEFSNIVLDWSWDIIAQPLIDAVDQPPLPYATGNASTYYENFKPFILEEARAIINNGLSKARQHQYKTKKHKRSLADDLAEDAKPFDIKFKKVKFPRNSDNPVKLTFTGGIPKKIEHGFTMNVLMLYSKNPYQRVEWLGLASESPDENLLNVRIVDYEQYLSPNDACFKSGHWWSAHYLGSILSEERMYQACVQAVSSSCLKNIIRANLSLSKPPAGIPFLGLNQSQFKAISTFLNAPKGSTTLLQGPPGTGKTTTIAQLLKILDKKQQRTLISAHSNKGVQVLAEKTMKLLPNAPMILVAVEKKISPMLRRLSLNSWYGDIKERFELIQGCILTINSKKLVSHYYKKQVNLIREHLDFIQSQWSTFKFFGKGKKSFGFNKAAFCQLYKYLDANLYEQISGFSHEISEWQEIWKNKSKHEVELHILNTATMIFATLVSTGRRIFAEMKPIDILLVDEAAQSIEAATLIPLQYKPKKVLLVGDPQQLPGVVVSTLLKPQDVNSAEDSKNYDWSMMWRLINEAEVPHLMLDTQYRMHPSICQWPSSQYYDGKLKTGPDILPMPLLNTRGLARRPYAFYSITGKAEKPANSVSVFNQKEALYIVKIIQHFRRLGIKSPIGVITPYVAQRQLLIKKLSKDKLLNDVEVNTVDAFQGDERAVIIVSLVRTHVTAFLQEYRRLNVAITRAKNCLIVLGNARTLNKHDIGELINNARSRHVLFSEADLIEELNSQSIEKVQVSQAFLTAKKLLEGVSGKPNLTAARQQFLGLARKGHVEAQFQLAMMYQLAQGGKRQVEEAIRWHQCAAQQDYSASLYQLYLLQKDSKPVIAINFLMRAAELLHSDAQYDLGTLYLIKNHLFAEVDLLLADKWLNLSAKPLSNEIALRLGKAYKEYAKKDRLYCRNAFNWFQYAADRKSVEGCSLTATCYETAYGVAKNISTAVYYLETGAKQGDNSMQFRLAKYLSKGFGNSLPDLDQAIDWYKCAAGGGYTLAYYPLACLLSKSDSHVEAFNWYHKAAEYDIEANLALARCYRYGQGTSVKINSSLHFYRKVAETKHQVALMELVNWLFDEQLADRDREEFMPILKLAADQYLPHLKSCYFYGFYLYAQKDYCQALIYFRKSETLFESAEALYCFGDALELAYLRVSNQREHFKFYAKAAQLGHSFSMLKVAHMLESKEVYCQAVDIISARVHYGKAALDGIAVAKYHYARFLEEGIGGQRDLNEAIKWYESASGSYNLANYRLACILIDEQDSKNSRLKAREYLHIYTTTVEKYGEPCNELATLAKVANRPDYAKLNSSSVSNEYLLSLADYQYNDSYSQSYIDAHYRLGQQYQSANDLPADFIKAKKHFETAVHFQHTESLYAIGRLYEQGLLGEMNVKECKHYYTKAAEAGHSLAAMRISTIYVARIMFGGFFSKPIIPSDEELKQRENECLIM